MSPVATVAALWRYPVKSLQGEPLEHTAIDEVIHRDRAWGIVDAASTHLMSAKRYPELLMASARLEGDDCVIVLPDGSTTGSADPEVDARLSAWLGRHVRLEVPTADERRDIDIELDEGQDDPGELPLFAFASPPGRFHDSSSAMHLISTATLAHLDHTVGSGAGDVRRFRPNVVLDLGAGAAPFAEDAWVDRVLELGTATAWVKKPTDRCVVVTRAQPGLTASRDALRHLARHNGRSAGLSAEPRRAGTVALADEVTFAG